MEKKFLVVISRNKPDSLSGITQKVYLGRDAYFYVDRKYGFPFTEEEGKMLLEKEFIKWHGRPFLEVK